MCAHDGAVDHGVFVIGLSRQFLEHLVPNAAGGPAAEPPMHVLAVTKPFRQITPGNARPVPVKHSLDKQPVVLRRDADCTFSPRQQVLDPAPFVVSQRIASRHLSAPPLGRPPMTHRGLALGSPKLTTRPNGKCPAATLPALAGRGSLRSSELGGVPSMQGRI